ncbi:MAG: cobaltochelatase subunit CobN [Methanobacteriaceae archaeon]|nr:cobaltochelatase subunit CobN [Methanobacteriaceae archaeon]MDO9626707.1 cobaltochelatase subunit CobN [Methanobacteriaceae archaeon]
MKKNVILLVTTLFFIIAMCGAVSATENNTGGDQNNSQIVISGQVLDCVTKEPFAGVDVTASNNGNNISKTKTDNQGKYELKFLSNYTQFNITASQDGHKSSTKLVNVDSDSNNQNKNLSGNANFEMGKPKVLIIVYSVKPGFLDAIKDCDFLNITFYTYTAGNLPQSVNITDYDMVFVDYLASGLKNNDYVNRVAALMNQSAANGIPTVMTINYAISIHSAVIIANGNSQYQWMRDYWSNINYANGKELFKFIGVKFFGLNVGTPQIPIYSISEAIYHPDANKLFASLDDYKTWYQFKAGKPTVGIVFSQSEYSGTDMATMDSLIRAFENKGYNVIPYFYPHSGTPNINKFLLQNNQSAVDLIIHYKMFGWTSNSSYNDTQLDLQKLDVPIIKAYKYFGNYSSWLNGTQGMQASTLGSTIVPSELDGMFDPIIIATQEEMPQYLPYTITLFKPIDRQINWLVDSAIAWINLRYESNSDKKIAIIYWHGTGKDQGATAGHLDVYNSISSILQALKDSGYDLGTNNVPNNNTLVDLIRNQGLNVGLWAPGELEKLVKNNPVILVSESEYLTWFNKLNAAKRKEVIDMWGEPPGDIMTYTKNGVKYLVLPVIQYGNIILAPEPSRGYNQDIDAMYHAGSVPPTHQYLAFYFWLKNDFKADAIIDMGRHGTVAWLPGKTGPGLDIDNCWAAIVSQDIPVIYPFTVEGSEGMLPKRRQGALMISHLTPSLTVSGLYGNLTILNDKISEYNSPNIDAETKAKLKISILQLVKDLKINEDIGVNLTTINDTNFDQFLGKVHAYLDDIESEFIPYGLHVFGQPPQGDELTNLVQSLLGFGFRDYMKANNLSDAQVQLILKKLLIEGLNVNQAQISVLGSTSPQMTTYLNQALVHAANINKCTNEMTGLLRALNGRYIPPGISGDPINNPNVLPTGTNFYSFDPRKVPTAEATAIGNKLAQDLIDDYLKKTGNYPTKISFMLWAIHTQQDMGVMEAAIFYLLGVERVPDASNPSIVTDVKLITNLGRPRIDVVVSTTALYLTMFRCRLDLIDKAVRLAAAANDTQPNYVKQNSENTYQYLKSKGYSDDMARKLSMARIFSQEEGNHKNAMQHALLAGGSWENESQLADTYISTFGNLFQGSEVNSILFEDLYKQNLNGTEAVVFRRTFNANSLFSDSDYMGYFGGLGLTIREISGKEPLMYIMNTENTNNPKLETLAESLWRDVRSTYINPKYIGKMMQSGAPGAAQFSEFIKNMAAWRVTSHDSVNSNMFQEAYDVYFKDKYNLNMKKWFDSANPYSHQAMAAVLLDSIRKGYWDASESDKKSLVNIIAQNVIDNGMACSDSTCGNLAMMQWASQYLDPNMLAKFKNAVYTSTLSAGFAPEPAKPSEGGNPSEDGSDGSSDSGSSGGSSTSSGSDSNSGSSSASSQDKSVSEESQATTGEQSSQKAYEVSENNKTSSKPNNNYIYAIVGLLALLGLIGFGYFKGVGRN